MVKVSRRQFRRSASKIQVLYSQWLGPAGLQLNQSRLPATEHRAQACSTKDRGISAASSSSTPAKVMPWIRLAELSSLPPKM